MTAFQVCLWVFAGVCAGCWLLSALTREYSWIDRIWSVVPVVYTAVFAGSAGFSDARLDLLLVLVFLWGARLTFNYARKGGYAPGGEDYRWAILRGRMKPWQFQLFNLFFITLYQNAILLLIALPAWTALEHRTPLGALDFVLAAAFLACLAGETVADQQQWNFHQWKKRETAAGRTPEPRFAQTGLFRFSRHPNFFFEQAQWWLVYLLGVSAAGSLTWTALGAFLLTCLFIGSTRFTASPVTPFRLR
jgi:steroid 5-alpha reductase family enzyme